ncbi:cytochrome c3 family protein [Carboxylicivirga linearis]|uniref:NapC/NirT family cytochrome c n=1 Tax=Carboxylicivirga linearis TaxID=1628157 RepID=A0ABS5K0H4_9BACT|nr:NapC/NirT family cytochrome c [Carboxylicivirga linearis]MBS2100224.1 NapC/NirT family cytochrome c [Carboxylicivirga linearis]
MRFPKSYYNHISLVGTIIAGISILLIILSFILSFIFNAGSSYLGLFSYILLPGIMLLGLILIPIGMLFSTRKARKNNIEQYKKWIVIDFNDPRYRNAASVFFIGTVVLMLLSAVGSYEAYHYTESVEFCGKVCHKVMKPEYVTYTNSSHARVACVECHVGQGADWYVKSKLSGLYQVYAVATNNYPKPIPTPISSLRPAKETCEECHWPQKFYTPRLHTEKHYLSDSLNTEWMIQLQMKTNSQHSSNNLAEGIHWHINPNVKIEYIAADETRESIPWVRYINLKTNDTTLYEDTWGPLDPEDIKTATIRTMDCMDCHNRPSHNYHLPSDFVDYAISSGDIPKLPQIKYIAMEVLKDPYPTTDTALMVIKNTIQHFYEENYSELQPEAITQAIEGISNGYLNNIFPEMGANWDVYPDHIGHVEFNGCFRCHNDTHESLAGNKITKDCNACHSILMQGTPGQLESASINEPLEFHHPIDIGTDWKDYLCTDCHRYLYP